MHIFAMAPSQFCSMSAFEFQAGTKRPAPEEWVSEGVPCPGLELFPFFGTGAH